MGTNETITCSSVVCLFGTPMLLIEVVLFLSPPPGGFAQASILCDFLAPLQSVILLAFPHCRAVVVVVVVVRSLLGTPMLLIVVVLILSPPPFWESILCDFLATLQSVILLAFPHCRDMPDHGSLASCRSVSISIVLRGLSKQPFENSRASCLSS